MTEALGFENRVGFRIPLKGTIRVPLKDLQGFRVLGFRGLGFWVVGLGSFRGLGFQATSCSDECSISISPQLLVHSIPQSKIGFSGPKNGTSNQGCGSSLSAQSQSL